MRHRGLVVVDSRVSLHDGIGETHSSMIPEHLMYNFVSLEKAVEIVTCCQYATRLILLTIGSYLSSWNPLLPVVVS